MTKQMFRSGIAAFAALLLLMGAAAQQPTPVTVQLATSTPLPILGENNVQATQALPTPSETPQTSAQLEALTESNVRAEASTESERLGLIAPGERYTITGRYFRWLQFRYPNSPTGYAWVYDELVQVTGDQSLIPDLSVAPPTLDPQLAAPTLTAAAILAVPGGDLTATAGARILDAAVGVDGSSTIQSESNLNPEGASRLPTFTPAPNVNQLVAQSAVQPTSTAENTLIDLTISRGGLPPILPIAALFGFGLLGLAVSFMRR